MLEQIMDACLGVSATDLNVYGYSCLRRAFSSVFDVEYEDDGFVWTCTKPLTWGAIRSANLIIWTISQLAVDIKEIPTYRYLYSKLRERHLKICSKFPCKIN